MPSTYFVDFTAYVDERKRPEGFPHEVHIQDTYEKVESPEHLQHLVNTRFVNLVTSSGIVVLREPTAIIESGTITFDKRRFIPWHMLTHMELRVELIPEPNQQSQDLLVPPNSTPEKKSKESVN